MEKNVKRILKLILLIIALLLIQGKVSAAVDSAGIYVKKSNNHTSGKYIITREGDDEIPTGETSITLTKSTNEWTNGDVTVTATMTIPSEEQAKYYIEMSTDGTTWTKTNTVTLNANGRVYARLSNGIYNGNSKYIDVTNIDKENPTTTAPELTATTNSITATYKQTDGISGIKVKKYRITNAEGTTGEWIESTEGAYTFTGLTPGTQYYIQTYGEDYAGNNTISEVGAITTGTIPSGEGNITLTPDKTEWTNGNVIVTASTSLTGYTIQTSTDGTTWTTTNPVTVETNNTTVYARLYDGTNYGEPKTYKVTNIDKENPTTTAPEVTLISETATKADVTIRNNQIDSLSGIKVRKYRLTNATGTTGTWYENNTDTYTFPELTLGQTYYFQTYAEDNVGNGIESEVLERTINSTDNEAPTNTAPGLTSTSKSITATYNQIDSGSGIKVRKYRLTNAEGTTGDWITIDEGIYTFNDLDENTLYYVQTYAEDYAGNVTLSMIGSIKTVAIPAGEGNITLTPSTTSWTKNTVTVMATSTISEYIIYTSTDGENWDEENPVTVSSNNTTVYARLYDGRNYGAATTYKVTNIDKTAPTDTAPEGVATTGTITVTFKQEDTGSGIKTKKYRLTNVAGMTGTWQESTDSTYTFTELTPNTTYYVQTYAEDNVGNTAVSQVTTVTTGSIPTGEGNIELTPSTTDWTKDNVTVTATTELTGYTIQTSTNGTTWTTTNPVTVSTNNTTVYARLYDGTSYGGAKTYTVEKIDKQNPTYSTFTIDNATSSGYEINVTGVADALSGVKKVEAELYLSSAGESTKKTVTLENKGSGAYYYKVDFADVNGEAGTYVTKIIVYDNVENTVSASKNTTATGVAQIGTTKYVTLQSAFNAVPTTNTATTVTLLKNIAEKAETAENTNITLNLGGYTFNNTNESKSFTLLNNNGKLKITNGTIQIKDLDTTGTSYIIKNNEELETDSSITIKFTNVGNNIVGLQNVKKLTMNGTTITQDSSSYMATALVTNSGTAELTNVKMTANGVSESSGVIEYGCGCISNGGDMTISGGTFIATGNAITNRKVMTINNNANISKSAGGSSTCRAIMNMGGSSGTCKLTINGATISTNGNYTQAIDNYLDGEVTISGSTTAISTTGNIYATPTIENEHSAGKITISAGTVTSANYISVRNNGTLEIKGTAVIENDSAYATVYNKAGTTTISGGTITNNKTNGVAVLKEGGTVTITGGTINGTQSI